MKHRNHGQRSFFNPSSRSSLNLGILLIFLYFPAQTSAQTLTSCWAIGAAEFLVPGLGYSLSSNWEKAAILGGSRWAALLGFQTFSNDPDYQTELDKVYDQRKVDGKTHTDVFLNRETFWGNRLLSVYSNLTFVTIHDLYEERCEKNPKTFSYMLSPYQWKEYGTEPTFFLPMTALLGGWTISSQTEFTYHLEGGLHRNELLLGSFFSNQLVGMGEEMLFRGVIQRSLFEWLSQHYSQSIARWSSIVSASAVFGVAHSGIGGTATPGSAFLSGLYLGWVYHPAEGGFDLGQVIALHSWWNTLIEFYRISHSDVREQKKKQLKKGQKARRRPLVNLVYRF